MDPIIQPFAGGEEELHDTICSMACTIKVIHPMLQSDTVGNSMHFFMILKETLLVSKFMG